MASVLSDPSTLYKLMILYMLNRVKFPLKGSQISEFFLGKGYTDFFTFQKAIGELTDAHLITEEKMRSSSRYEISREGSDALGYFGGSISDAIKGDIDDFLRENKIRLRNEVGVVSDYYKSTNSDYVVRMEVREGKNPLVSMEVSVPTADQAEAMCANWQNENQRIYAWLMQELLKSSQDV